MHVNRRDTETLFWIAVVFSNSLGTAFGDFLTDNMDLSYVQGAIVTAGIIGLVVALHYMTKISDVLLFWIAFVFTRPFGATFGDFLTKPIEKGGLNLPRDNASLVTLGLPGRCPDAVHVEAAIKDGRPAGVVPRQSNGCLLRRRISPAQFRLG